MAIIVETLTQNLSATGSVIAAGAITLGDAAGDVLLGTTDKMVIAATGITQPLQPAFLATCATQSNVTGDGTVYTVLFANEIFDQGGNFASPTWTFPVTGRYRLSFNLDVFGLVLQTSVNSILICTSRSFNFYYGVAASTVAELPVQGSVLVDAIAGNTASITLTATGSTKTVSINGTQSYFCGELVV